jgi:hypothetical protein
MRRLLFFAAFVLFFSGCLQTGPACSRPNVQIGEECCLDANRNGICDGNETTIMITIATEANAVTALTTTETEISTLQSQTTTGLTTTSTLAPETKVKCYVNNDCGINGTLVTRNYTCNEGDIYTQYVVYRCTRPGTTESDCIGTEDSEIVRKCYSNETCVEGKPRCKPEELMCLPGLDYCLYNITYHEDEGLTGSHKTTLFESDSNLPKDYGSITPSDLDYTGYNAYYIKTEAASYFSGNFTYSGVELAIIGNGPFIEVWLNGGNHFTYQNLTMFSRSVYDNGTNLFATVYLTETSASTAGINVTKGQITGIEGGYTLALTRVVFKDSSENASQMDYAVITITKPRGEKVNIITGPGRPTNTVDGLTITYLGVPNENTVQLRIS